MWFNKFFRTDPKEQAVKLLQKSAQNGDIQAQQMLRLYHTLQSRHFNPIHESFHSAIEDKLIAEVLKEKKPPSLEKKEIKRNKRARSPKVDK